MFMMSEGELVLKDSCGRLAVGGQAWSGHDLYLVQINREGWSESRCACWVRLMRAHTLIRAELGLRRTYIAHPGVRIGLQPQQRHLPGTSSAHQHGPHPYVGHFPSIIP